MAGPRSGGNAWAGFVLARLGLARRCARSDPAVDGVPLAPGPVRPPSPSQWHFKAVAMFRRQVADAKVSIVEPLASRRRRWKTK